MFNVGPYAKFCFFDWMFHSNNKLMLINPGIVIGYVSYERDTKLYHNFFGHLKLNDTLNKLHS